MAIQRWEPGQDLARLQRQVNRLFDEALARSVGPEEAAALAGAWRPPLDLSEESDRFVVRADLPGVSPHDVEVQVVDGALVLSGERRLEPGASRESFLRVERPQGRFTLRIALPPAVESGAIEAAHRNGVLEVVLPKKRASRPERIPLRSA